MKSCCIIFLLLCSYYSGAQAVFADPALDQAFFTNINGTQVDAPPVLARETVYVLKVPVYNNNAVNAIQQGTTKLKIGLGSKLILDPSFNLSTTNTSAYFNWTAEVSGGQVQLTGDQFAPVPPGFSDTAEFLVRGVILGVSTVTANFLVTNHNGGSFTLSDDNGANNLTAQAYFISESLPVTFVNLEVHEEQCVAVVRFTTADEYNLRMFVVEYAANGLNFQPVVQLLPHGNGLYETRFAVPADIDGGKMQVRIRSVDIDGRQKFSEIKILRNLCRGFASIVAFPNPVRGNSAQVAIQKNNGSFNGQYRVTLFDAAGAAIKTRSFKLVNTRVFDFSLEGCAAGSYTIHMDNAQEVPVILKLQKMN